MKNYLLRFKNVGTVISVVSIGALIANQFGFKVDLVWLDNTIKLVCSLGVVLGVMNNPTTPKMDLPFVSEIKPAGEVTDFKG
ncbi:hypothetical protein [Clostridium gasigenes]|uniref:Uncharacterized membrane protein n=1 Tax=Clostridium gasigenes TaxID=94869 RepID=A0A1H0N720_9CLOT|nr:hypothetical protein [Clostridium gasigenes]SDO88482.1 Uncharacterized membrane protein [Clostridium gasigenes]